MYRNYGLTILTFNDHFDGTDAPNIVGVPHVNSFAYLYFVDLLLELPLVELAFLSFAAYFDVGLLAFLDELGYDIIDGEAWLQNRAFCIPNSLVAYEARLFDDEVLVDAPSAEVVSANSRLALVDEVQAQRANQRLVIITRYELLVLAILRRSISHQLVINELLNVLEVHVRGRKLFLLDHLMDLPQLFLTVDHSL